MLSGHQEQGSYGDNGKAIRAGMSGMTYKVTQHKDLGSDIWG